MERISNSVKTSLNVIDPATVAKSTMVTSMILFMGWCVYDYHQYLALGPGGPPYNVRGWAMITFTVRPFALSYVERLKTSDYPDTDVSDFVRDLPAREGSRAKTGGIAPHRQLSQHAPQSMRSAIEDLFTQAALQNGSLLEIRRSLYERHHSALFLQQDVLESNNDRIPKTAVTARGEIGHVHPDLSIHLYVSPADAKVLVEKGWAERHRLAVPRTSWIKDQYAVADTYLMIYGPRNNLELESVRKMLVAGISFMSGQQNVILDYTSWAER